MSDRNTKLAVTPTDSLEHRVHKKSSVINQSMMKYFTFVWRLWHSAGHFDQFYLVFDKHLSLIHD